MENQKESSRWLSVPAFGDWEQKDGGLPDYSVDFSKIREVRKLNKSEFSKASFGTEDELIPRQPNPTGGEWKQIHRLRHHTHSPTTKRKILSYFNCCISS